MRSFYLLFIALLLFSGVGISLASERLLMSHEGMDAYLYGLDCNNAMEARLEIRTGNPELYDGDTADLQRLIGQARAAISFECSDIQRITARGMSNGQLYYSGATEKRWKWRIVGLYAPPKR